MQYLQVQQCEGSSSISLESLLNSFPRLPKGKPSENSDKKAMLVFMSILRATHFRIKLLLGKYKA